MAVLADPIFPSNFAGTRVSAGEAMSASELGPDSTAEVMQFLSRRPKHTFGMQGLIRDNGLNSPLNRGGFYGCRTESGELIGVALIGHHTLFEVTSNAALECFALIARQCKNSHMVLGEVETVERFWSYYREDRDKEARFAWRELLMEMDAPIVGTAPVPSLRIATLADLDLIVPVHAEMALEESGVNPLETDPDGFKARSARRVEQGRVWVWVENDRLVYKAEIVSDTPDLVYIEGVWVNPEYRGQGYLARCLSQMAGELLHHGRSLCILVNENKASAIKAYTKAGFKVLSHYTAIFL